MNRDLLRAIVDTDRALVQRGRLYDFVRIAWPVVEPSPLEWNWHLEEVCNHLEAVSRGEILRLVLNQPPGTAKSSVTGIFWPIWEWIFRPGTKWIFASYDASLVGTRDGGKVIKLLQSDWFRLRWGTLLPPGKPAASSFVTVRGGFRFATSVAGRVTGRHADIQVVDDPIKPRDATGGATMTKSQIQTVSSWWKDTMSSRMVNQATGRRVIVMQRLTDDDLAGEMLRTGEYVHLRLPMEYRPDRPCHTPWGGDRRTEKGELLFPARFPASAVHRLRTSEMGERVYSAQCQQEPAVEGGGTFKRIWFRFWHTQSNVPEPCLCEECFSAERQLPGHTGPVTWQDYIGPGPCDVLPPFGVELQSWDMTFDDTETSDFVAGGVIRTLYSKSYLLDVVNQRLDFVETLAAVKRMSEKHPKTYDKLVESKANGPAVIRMLKNHVPGLTPVEPMGSKEARANASQPVFQSGEFLIPHPALVPWAWSYMKQLEAFPKGAHDDLVDMTTQALVRLRAHGASFQEAMRRIREGKK